jgi:hypothetical protein
MNGTLPMLLAVLALLGTVGLVTLALAVAAWSRVKGRRDLFRRAGMLGAALVGTYAVALIGGGLASHEQVLPAGTEKVFCELDCHLAHVVTDVQGLGNKATGRPGDQATRTWSVTLRTRFDETTISSRRPLDLPLAPAPRRVALVGSDGRRYEADRRTGVRADMEKADGRTNGQADRADTTDGADRNGSSPRLDRPLKPGESYQTVLRFELPAGVTPTRLYLTDDIPISPFLIGHERSPWHAPVYLALPSASVVGT